MSKDFKDSLKNLSPEEMELIYTRNRLYTSYHREYFYDDLFVHCHKNRMNSGTIPKCSHACYAVPRRSVSGCQLLYGHFRVLQNLQTQIDRRNFQLGYYVGW